MHVHTHQGWSTDGTCNELGQAPAKSGGRSSASLFGRQSSRPSGFRVDAAFGDGSLSTTLSHAAPSTAAASASSEPTSTTSRATAIPPAGGTDAPVLQLEQRGQPGRVAVGQKTARHRRAEGGAHGARPRAHHVALDGRHELDAGSAPSTAAGAAEHHHHHLHHLRHHPLSRATGPSPRRAIARRTATARSRTPPSPSRTFRSPAPARCAAHAADAAAAAAAHAAGPVAGVPGRLDRTLHGSVPGVAAGGYQTCVAACASGCLQAASRSQAALLASATDRRSHRRQWLHRRHARPVRALVPNGAAALRVRRVPRRRAPVRRAALPPRRPAGRAAHVLPAGGAVVPVRRRLAAVRQRERDAAAQRPARRRPQLVPADVLPRLPARGGIGFGFGGLVVE